MRLAERLQRCGSRTTFAVSIEATVWVCKGRGISSLQPVVRNPPIPDNVVRAVSEAIEDGKTGYLAFSAGWLAPASIGLTRRLVNWTVIGSSRWSCREKMPKRGLVVSVSV